MSMADRDGVIWYDGKLVPWRDATTHVLTHTLHYGMGVFEGVRAYKAEQGTAIFRLQEHTDRLFRSAHILGMKLPFDKATISEAQRTVVRENKLESGYLRPMAFFGKYIEVTPPTRLVWTNDEGEDDGAVTTVTFEEQDGYTEVVLRDLYPSEAALDEAIASGSTGGFNEQFDQLDACLAENR